MTKATKKPKARARARGTPATDAAVVEAPETAPAPNAPAPETQAAVVAHADVAVVSPEPDPVGLRTNPAWSHRDRNPRPLGPLTKTATLVRGIGYTVSYSNGPLVLRKGVAVPITDTEFERLKAAVDPITFADPGTGLMIQRSIRKFIFADAATGEAIELPPIPDVECGPGTGYRDAFEETAAKKKFEGQEYTAR